MSTKEFFDKGYSLKFLKNKAQADFRDDVESFRYVDAYSKRRDRYVPDTDFATASNFAAYGLAELYYKQSIERIYKTYPYDGSLAEKIEWENSSTYLDLYMFENEYPRSNGYINISNTYTTTAESNAFSSSLPQYVLFKGNPHADISGNYKEPETAGPSGVGVSKANIYETGSQRTNNLEMDPTKGVSIEFWMKKDGWAATNSTKYEYVFNLVASGSTGDKFGNLRIFLAGTAPGNINFTINSGSSSDTLTFATGLSDGAAGGLADSKWHHYAITFKKSGSINVGKLYVDGVHKETENGDDHVGAIDGNLFAAIGALAGPRGSNLTIADRGWGGLVSSSIDEFRYWKTERDAQQIGRHFRDQIGGGTNTDDIKYNKTHNPVDLGVYFKFNEGVTGDNSIDKTVLDYSGRVSNGTFINYISGTSRNTGSAMVTAGVANKEFKDPILYSSHPDVVDLFEKKRIEGTVHDHENATSIFKSLPGWIAEEDEKKSDNLKFLTQIMASVFDEMQLQIKSLPRLKDINYPYDANFEKPLPFADRLLSTRGIDAPELFSDASILAKFLERDEKKLFEKKLYEVKNTIYQNIYNNLTYIQKSKGTTKSIRNLLRCFGVDEELVKINIYAKNDTYEFKNNVSHTAFRKKYADFDDALKRYNKNGIYQGSFGATVYQYYDPANSNSKSYVPGLTDIAHGLSSTLEAEVIFPKRSHEKDDLFGLFPGNEVSLFGLHAVTESDTVLTWLNDTINFNVIAVKDPVDNRRVKFKLTSNASSVIPELQTTSSYDVYDNEKWNFAFRLRPTKTINNDLIKPHSSLANDVDGSLLPEASAYTVELYGVNYVSDHLQNEFTLSATISEPNARAFFTKAKRVYAGAHRTNYNSTLIRACDARISSVAMWYDYLNDEDIKAHARDASNFGRLHPYKNAAFNEANAAGMTSLFDARVPEIDTLIFHWNFENVTGSDASGQFLALDISSGSAEDRTNQRYGVLSNVNTYHYSARGDLFEASNNQVVDVQFVPTAKQKLPEVVNSDDMIKILNQQDDVVFTRDTTYVQHIISVEKSMYQAISNEMMRMFATVADFNNIIGNPVNRYRQNYKQLSKLRGIFFEIVENTPDLEKYIEYFKWIDDAISLFIFQLLPASSNKVEFLRNMVESHILERSKHFNKFPTIEMFNPEPNEAFKGVNHLLYNWKFGHAPLQTNGSAPDQAQNQHMHSLWWKERAERTGSVVQGVNHAAVLTSGDDNVDSDKQQILKIAITETSGNDNLSLSFGPSGLDKADGKYGAQGGTKVKYSASYYPDRSTSTPVRVTQDFVKTYKSGPNPDSNKIYDFYKGVIKFASDNDYIFLDKDHVVKPLDSTDILKAESSSSSEGFYLPNKKEYIIKALTMTGDEISESNAAGTGDDDYKYTDALNKLTTPFTMFANKGVADGDYTVFYQNYFEDGHHSSQNDTTRVEINNLHHDIYRPSYEVPLQGPFSAQHVGGNQHRHIGLNYQDYSSSGDIKSLDTRMSRAEAWDLVHDKNMSNYIILDMPFSEFNMPPEMSGSDPTTGHVDNGHISSDPEPRDRWKNVHKNNTFPASPQMNLAIESKTGWQRAEHITAPEYGPASDSGDGTGFFAYARVENNANNEYKFFGYRTPLVDAHDVKRDIAMTFYYHVSSPVDLETGNFSISYSYDEDFSDGGTALNTLWDKGAAGETLSVILPKDLEQTSKDDPWKLAEVNLNIFIGKRVYLRFNYLAAPHSFNLCAIDQVKIVAVAGVSSLRVLHPTHDDHHRPYATQMREEYAKRPVNIRNVEIGSLADITGAAAFNSGNFGALQRTVAGNYRNNYEIFHTVGNEANDKTFKEIVLQFQDTPDEQPKQGKQEVASMYLGWASDESGVAATPWLFAKTQHGTEGRLARYKTTHAVANSITSSTKVEDAEVKPVPGRDRQNTHELVSGPLYREYKQQTRMVNIFSAPGDILDSCVGFKDEAHRTFSAYNALPWRNYHIRQRLKSSLTAHCGRFGAGAHTQDAIAASGSIKIANNTLLEALSVTGTQLTRPAIQLVDWKGITLHISLVPNANPDNVALMDVVKVGAPISRYFVYVKIGATAQETANNIKTAIIDAGSLGADEAPEFLDIFASIDPDDNTKVDLVANSDKLGLPQYAKPGAAGNTPIRTGKAGLIALDDDGDGIIEEGEFDEPIDSTIIQIVSFNGGKNATARVYRSQAVSPAQQPGTISKEDYSVVSASFHKYHRNRGDKLILGEDTQGSWEYNISGSTQLPHDHLARGSVYDNAYISHAIPRKNDYPKWIRSVTGLIQEELWLEVDDSGTVTQEVLKLQP